MPYVQMGRAHDGYEVGEIVEVTDAEQGHLIGQGHAVPCGVDGVVMPPVSPVTITVYVPPEAEA